MASIQKRITEEGRTTYQALIRIKGRPKRPATFDGRSDAPNFLYLLFLY